MQDQASKLRTMVGNKRRAHSIKIYSIVGGDNGRSKANIAINLATRLQQMDKKVIILDADTDENRIDTMLKIEVPLSLSDVIRGEASLEDAIIICPGNVHLISGGADLLLMEDMDSIEREKIIKSMGILGNYDILIINDGADMSKQSLKFTEFAHEVILVTNPESEGLMDGYKIIKSISLYELKDRINIILNQVQDQSYGESAYEKLSQTASRFLDLKLKCMGFISGEMPSNKDIDKICGKILKDISNNYYTSSLKELDDRLARLLR